jgi:outer membrane protein OmpA-like peptidoglycan-associated protein
VRAEAFLQDAADRRRIITPTTPSMRRTTPRPVGPSGAVLTLQRQVGNSAVSELLAETVQRACCPSCEESEEAEESQGGEGKDRSGPAVQRFASCNPARLSLQDCPPRQTGERQRARSGPMVFLPQLSIPGAGTGVLIGNFDIGSSAIKPNLNTTIYWQQFLTQLQSDQTTWQILGFSDCAGKAKDNAALRTARATSVQSVLPLPLQSRITSAAGANIGDCITENDSAADRTLNRSVAMLLVSSTHDMPEEKIEGTITKPTDPSFDDCEPGDRDLIARWDTIATMMAGKALAGLEKYRTDDPNGQGDPLVSDLLVDSFGFQGSGPHLAAVILGFTRIKDTFAKSDYQYECEDDCDGDHAYVYDVWTDIHMCMDALRTRAELYSSGVALHEMSHYSTGTDDLEYFYYGSPATTSLHPDDAIGNADGYQAFATEYYKRG